MIDKKIIDFEKRANANNIDFADDLKQMLHDVIFFNNQVMLDWFRKNVMLVSFAEKNKEVDMFCLKR